jgi:hypothetical protein
VVRTAENNRKQHNIFLKKKENTNCNLKPRGFDFILPLTLRSRRKEGDLEQTIVF